jgi:hypothetical protein
VSQFVQLIPYWVRKEVQNGDCFSMSKLIFKALIFLLNCFPKDDTNVYSHWHPVRIPFLLYLS